MRLLEGMLSSLEQLHIFIPCQPAECRINLSDKKYVDLPEEVVQRHSVKDGDLLLARAIGSIGHLGKCIVAYPGEEKWAFDSHLMRVRFKKELAHPEFIRSLLMIPSGRQLFLQNTRKSAVQFNINSKEFSAIAIPLPPIDKQKVFVDRVNELGQLSYKGSVSASSLETLFQTLLHRAFSGDLTAEWRKAHMTELLQEMEHQARVLGLEGAVE